ncbi:hypothetical protein ACXM5X_16815 [Pseudomonas saponiphila]
MTYQLEIGSCKTTGNASEAGAPVKNARAAGGSEFSLLPLAPDLAQVTYLCHNAAAGGLAASSAWRSSLWRCREGRWQMLFHQGTPRPSA